MSDDRPSQPRSWLEKLTHLFSDGPEDREDIKEIIRAANARNLLDDDTLSILNGALQVSEMQVRDIMVPRAQVVTLQATDSIEDFLPRIIDSAHSRFPVLGDDPDEVVGLLLAKDLLPYVLKHDGFDLNALLRPCTFVPESKRLNVLLREFRANHNHMAVVVDEFGGIAGVVTIEDVLEQIVGEIEDEHDHNTDEFDIRDLGNGVTIVNARVFVEDFNEHFNAQFSDEEFDTIGGIVVDRFGRLPERNESITIERWTFKVIAVTNRQVDLLEVSVCDTDTE